jgi:hypothetical protein
MIRLPAATGRVEVWSDLATAMPVGRRPVRRYYDQGAMDDPTWVTSR